MIFTKIDLIQPTGYFKIIAKQVNYSPAFLFGKEKEMKKLFLVLVFISGFAFIPQMPSVSVKDFRPAFGKWKGSLTYLDYSSGKPYSMPANITITANKQQGLILSLEYPDEPKANGKDTLFISADGTMIDGARVVLNKKNNEGSREIVTEQNGTDGNDNRKAVLRYIYKISKKMFISRKEVRFEGEEKFILRNEFKMNR